MSSRRTILLVEDELLISSYLEQLLADNAWTVTAVSSGDEALTRLEAFEFSMVLCDLYLGRGPNGLDLLRRMPEKNESTPFVLMTGHGSTARCREAFHLGATDFLEKPFCRESLLGTLDHAISDATEPSLPIGSEDGVPDLPYDAAGTAHVRRAINIIERRYAEFDLTIAKLAESVGVCQGHLTRLFRVQVGRSPLEYLHEVRINRAERLLLHSCLSIYEVGYTCGYKRTSEFSSWFRRLRGATPSTLRRA